MEGISRQAIWSKGEYHDVYMVATLKEEYFAHKSNGDYVLTILIKRLRQLIKEERG